MFTTTPLRNPLEGLEPKPIILTPWSVPTEATMTQILVVPMSSPTTICSFFAMMFRSSFLADDHLSGKS